MLILTRREGEAVLIDGGIRIVVVQIAGGHVRLGFDAPSSVVINRAELDEGLAAGPAFPDPEEPA